MISTNALSVFILHHHTNGIGNKNRRSIQEIVHASKPAAEKYKNFYEDFPNLAILNMSGTPGKVQLTFVHAADENNSPGESVVDFALGGYLSSPSVVSINMDIDFTSDGNKIRLPIAEVLLRAAASDLARSKKQRD